MSTNETNDRQEQQKESNIFAGIGIGKYFNTVLIAIVAYFLKVEFEEMKGKMEQIMKVIPLYEYRLANLETGQAEHRAKMEDFQKNYFIKPDELILKRRKSE